MEAAFRFIFTGLLIDVYCLQSLNFQMVCKQFLDGVSRDDVVRRILTRKIHLVNNTKPICTIFANLFF